MRIPVMAMLLICLCGLAWSQTPQITGGPYNAASYARTGEPNAGIAQGAIFVLIGANLGPPSLAIVNAFPLQTTLGGTSVTVTVNGTDYPGLMIYSLATQVAVILPSAVPTGDGTVRVSYNGQQSDPVPIHIAPTAFGIFSRNQAGTGPGIVQNYLSTTNTPTNSLVEAAHPGQIEILWGTGIGAVTGDEAAGVLPGDLPITVEVFVGGKPATITYRGRSGCCAGIDQIVFTVPEGVSGCYVPVAVRQNGVTSNFVTMAIAPSGSLCSDPSGLSTADLQKVAGGSPITIGTTSVTHAALFAGAVTGTADIASARFLKFASAADVLSYSFGATVGTDAVPSAGSCYVSPYEFDGNVLNAIFPDVVETSRFAGLSAGANLTYSGPAGNATVAGKDDGSGSISYDDVIGGMVPGDNPRPDFVVPGNITISNGDGAPATGVGPFSATLTVPTDKPTWTNRTAITAISRNQDLTLTWTAGAPGSIVAFLGSSADTSTNAGGSFLCAAPADLGTFTVPAWVLSAIPASGSVQGQTAGFLSFAVTLPQPVRFSADGLDTGLFNWLDVTVSGVAYQ